MADETISRRVRDLARSTPFDVLLGFFAHEYPERRARPGVLDLTFGNPHDPAPAEYVEALRASAVPRDEHWFGYKVSEPAARAAAAESLRDVVDLPFEPDDVHLTTGGFTALALALKLVCDPGDEVVYSVPPWFAYEVIVREAGLVPVKVPVSPETFDLDLDAIADAITPRTRVVLVNTPNNPTGRVYPVGDLRRLATLLDEASARNGRRVFVVSDEPYHRIVYDGTEFHSPAEVYPWTLLAYSYGKTLLAPGQRIGYLAVPPTLPGREDLRPAIEALQIAIGYAFPNAVLQHALPLLERIPFDVMLYQRKRDLMVAGLRDIGYDLHRPEGTFYLFPRSPDPDDRAFEALLADHDVLVLGGKYFETPGRFRISLTASVETLEASLPRFAAAFAEVG
ncbi:aminotransferase class I/II-fold pyridoxal phosphate-dependent enzyme [Oerskovia turbata]|uniref:Aminotransferase n=1 Tax=Oerskovia turbata TaxID=1713 RepID=A0A4Q1KY68_9CELL|nr:aminotransferase class I/II-fold pyridoxal phosphate-dependent enzyme [Oerskovia turbata]RXR25086.1 aminotransferase class I/II-fold pyridoxal phosphate-dependent enzyme [Oerskovia turbata]RXR35232.1 aminotransferase class I/II-fold pyridoxal phosphate-dependent enzyme [Oerskovia turbata]TGJ95290.1 aminotransferase class V-fold PLP-dependent enzyme [Actinotalea fermentans ATCC 43279 = JCM 9966 = DSM 3133]